MSSFTAWPDVLVRQWWRAALSCLSRPVDFAAGYMESPDPRDGAEGTEERVWALHTEELSDVPRDGAEGTEERVWALHTEEAREEIDKSTFETIHFRTTKELTKGNRRECARRTLLYVRVAFVPVGPRRLEGIGVEDSVSVLVHAQRAFHTPCSAHNSNGTLIDKRNRKKSRPLPPVEKSICSNGERNGIGR